MADYYRNELTVTGTQEAVDAFVERWFNGTGVNGHSSTELDDMIVTLDQEDCCRLMDVEVDDGFNAMAMVSFQGAYHSGENLVEELRKASPDVIIDAQAESWVSY